MDNLENSHCNILSLFLLRKDANLSRLVLRNLYKSQFYISFLIFVFDAFNIFYK